MQPKSHATIPTKAVILDTKQGPITVKVGQQTNREFIAAALVAGSVWYETSFSGLEALVQLQTRLQQRYGSTDLTPEKLEYFNWRHGWSGYEDVDSYIDEDRERRADLNITDADEKAWQERRDKEIDF